MRILVVNAGSSSLKLRVLEDDDTVAVSEDLPAPRGTVEPSSLAESIDKAGSVDAVGHRIVHGGTRFVQPVLLDDGVVAALRELIDLAPLHQPKSLAAMEAVRRLLPDVPAVACFDTAFHASMPAAASTYALPARWRARWDLKRYGFHGLSHAYASRRAAEMCGRARERFRVVTCHLGAGASLCAVADGRSVDTTMGFTPLEGLVMATRSGSVDPGLVLWLEEHAGTPSSELAATLEHRSGLLGLAGTDDMREVLARADAGDADARLAVDVYVHRLRGEIASMTASLGGLDVLAFTGGVGERSAPIRRMASEGLAFLGVRTDESRNLDATLDREITADGSSVRTLVIESREDLEIGRQVRTIVDAGP
ncbi:MAG: acetate/propionate family kinase [Actinomycetota bacterium]